MWVIRCYGRPLDGAERDNSEGVEHLSHLQDCIMEYLRQHPEGATAKAIAEGIGSSSAACRYSIRGLERWKMVESERVVHAKIWRAVA